jgi:hypothetical protein
MLARGRLLCAVTKQGVCVRNVSPVYRTQPIVLLGKTPVNYRRDWCEFVQAGTRKNHPTEKPLNVMEWLVELTTNEGDIVLDPFMGSGTTGVACVNTGRNFIGIEIDKGYYEIAERRIAEAQAKRESELFAKAGWDFDVFVVASLVGIVLLAGAANTGAVASDGLNGEV